MEPSRQDPILQLIKWLARSGLEKRHNLSRRALPERSGSRKRIILCRDMSELIPPAFLQNARRGD